MSKARLMTADEIRQLPRTSIVWIEFWNAEEGEATQLLPAMKCADGSLVDEDTCVFTDFEEDMKPQWDGWWRFWSDEPTSRQREETPWQ